MSRTELSWEEYLATLKPHEHPTLPGSPANPDHPPLLRLAYAGVGLLVTATGSLGNAAYSANAQLLAGAFGLNQVQVAWVPVVYVMTNACANLLLIKFRQQFGLRLFSELVLSVFVAVTVAHFVVTDFGSLLAVRAVFGICAAGLSTLGILYLIQAFPAAHRMKGLIIGIGLASFGAPAVRIFSPDLLDLAGWRGVELLELGLALVSIAAVFALRLPHAERVKVFQRLDFVSVALFAPGVALLCAVLGLGRIVWWTDAAWIGWALAGAIALLSATFTIEHSRERPLIDLRWLGTRDILRMGLIILIVRVVMSEQTSGAVGFLQQLGVGPHQLPELFGVILLATAAGTLVSAFTLNMDKLYLPIAAALALIAVGAFLDSHANSLVRPQNLFFSQSLIAFAAALFIGPALLIGIAPLLEKGMSHMVSFIVIFSTGQNLAGLAGSALIGTVVQLRAQAHTSHLAEGIVASDPDVALRLQQLSGAYAHTLVDPARREAAGFSLLQQQLAQQAQVLAYNDLFRVIAAIAALGALWIGVVHLRNRAAARKATMAGASSTAAQAVD